MSFAIRRAVPSDAKALTALYHDAYSIWRERGLRMGPMRQSEEATATQIAGRVFVAEAAGTLVGSFALDAGGAALLEYLDVPHSVPPGRLLAFKKAAVARSRAGTGIGERLFAKAEEIGREEGFIGMILETAPEAEWLVRWYERLGFQALGRYRYTDMDTDTLLMVYLFKPGV